LVLVWFTQNQQVLGSREHSLYQIPNISTTASPIMLILEYVMD
jgi:hypothetical protein